MVYGNKFYGYNLNEETQPIKPVEKSKPVDNQNSTSNNSNKNSSSNKEGDFKKDLQDSINAIKEEYSYDDFRYDFDNDKKGYQYDMQDGREEYKNKNYSSAINYFNRALHQCDEMEKDYEKLLRDHPEKEAPSTTSFIKSMRRSAEKSLNDAENKWRNR